MTASSLTNYEGDGLYGSEDIEYLETLAPTHANKSKMVTRLRVNAMRYVLNKTFSRKTETGSAVRSHAADTANAARLLLSKLELPLPHLTPNLSDNNLRALKRDIETLAADCDTLVNLGTVTAGRDHLPERREFIEGVLAIWDSMGDPDPGNALHFVTMASIPILDGRDRFVPNNPKAEHLDAAHDKLRKLVNEIRKTGFKYVSSLEDHFGERGEISLKL